VRRAVISLALAVGCGGAPPPLVVHPAEYDPVAETLTALDDGAQLHLQIPPQGGVVLFIGATVEGLGEAQAQLYGDLSLGGVSVGNDRRGSRFVRVAGGGDSVGPPLSSSVAMANVPVCPDGGLVALGMTATLQVTVSDDSTGRSASASVSVVPLCQQSDATLQRFCQCECAADFVPGNC
jgi:hypothetical protein